MVRQSNEDVPSIGVVGVLHEFSYRYDVAADELYAERRHESGTRLEAQAFSRFSVHWLQSSIAMGCPNILHRYIEGFAQRSASRSRP